MQPIERILFAVLSIRRTDLLEYSLFFKRFQFVDYIAVAGPSCLLKP